MFEHIVANKPIDVKNAIEKYNLNGEHTLKGVRNFLNYLEEKELIDDENLTLFRNKIKIKSKRYIDTYIPNSKEIYNLLEKVREYDHISYIYVKILIESGLRISEVNYLLENLEIDKKIFKE